MSDWRAPELGPARTLDMANGWRIRAHVTGEGPPIVFVHGALVNANLWRKVVPRLDGFTRVSLDLPLGSHLEALPRKPTLDVPALAELIADALEALDLRDAIVVGNDTGGGLTQIAAATKPGADRRAGAHLLRRVRQLPAALLSDRARPGAHPRHDPAGLRRPAAAGRCGGCRSPTAGSRTSRSSARPRTPTCCRC